MESALRAEKILSRGGVGSEKRFSAVRKYGSGAREFMGLYVN
jgi:hypothetical protein